MATLQLAASSSLTTGPQQQPNTLQPTYPPLNEMRLSFETPLTHPRVSLPLTCLIPTSISKPCCNTADAKSVIIHLVGPNRMRLKGVTSVPGLAGQRSTHVLSRNLSLLVLAPRNERDTEPPSQNPQIHHTLRQCCTIPTTIPLSDIHPQLLHISTDIPFRSVVVLGAISRTNGPLTRSNIG